MVIFASSIRLGFADKKQIFSQMVVFSWWCMVYLPTWMVDFYGKCRWIYQSHGWYGYTIFCGNLLTKTSPTKTNRIESLLGPPEIHRNWGGKPTPKSIQIQPFGTMIGGSSEQKRPKIGANLRKKHAQINKLGLKIVTICENDWECTT